MPSSDPTVADWIAEGEATIAIFCSPPNRAGCGHSAVVRLDTLDPRMTRSRLARRAVYSACGGRGGEVMRDMAAHDERMRAAGWDCNPFKRRDAQD
ncbi:MAG: hypothetical protein WAP03_16065 [Methylorubrum rhodinum]|uniref:hypothetical protein n=1 Tax=Methylorubrum rhodinum TaxID=29428 RepID=UPI003BAFA3D4